MEVEGSNLDTISSLPDDITAKILSLLPIKHALRTSILSKKWRYHWTRIPVLEFDDKAFEGNKYKFAIAIYHVLMLHAGPLLDFSLFCDIDMASEMDHIIHYLSRMNTLNEFNFTNNSANNYKLTSSFFSLQLLEHIQIKNCHFDPPLIFNGFSRLKRLNITDVKITAEMLQRLLTSCPLLKLVYMFGENKDITRGNKLTFFDLCECVPSIKHLGLSTFYMESDPQPLSMEFDLQDYSSLKLDHLEKLGISGFNNLAIEMEFVKLVMAKAHVLYGIQLYLSAKVSDDEEVRMRRDLMQLPFPRASPSAKLIIRRELKDGKTRPSFLREIATRSDWS